jgi:hypothetical protein
MAHKVFISHSSKDKTIADAICARLQEQNITCWIAHRDIVSSTEYAGAIVEAINESSVFVLVFSANSNRSKDVRNELNLAFKKGLPIIPFRIEDVQPSEDAAYYLSALDWLDAFMPPLEPHLKHLVEDVERLLEPGLPPQEEEEATAPPSPPATTQWKLILIAVGAVLAISIFTLWAFKSQKETDANLNKIIVTNPNEPATVKGNTNTVKMSSNTTNSPTVDINYQQQYEKAIALLHDTNSANTREGIRLLGEVCGSGNEKWYWIAMNQLTDYVRDNARWKDDATQLSSEMQTNIFRILEVIAAQPPLYPANAGDEHMRTHRRDLSSTDLRGLRLVEGGAHLEYVNFEGAHLDGAYLLRARLDGARLLDSSLKGANLYQAYMAGVDLVHANISKADLRGVEGLHWFDIQGATKWYCAAGVDDKLLHEIRSRPNFKEPTEKCD